MKFSFSIIVLFVGFFFLLCSFISYTVAILLFYHIVMHDRNKYGSVEEAMCHTHKRCVGSDIKSPKMCIKNLGF